MWFKVQRGLYLGFLTLVFMVVDERLVENPFPNSTLLLKTSTPCEPRAWLSNHPSS